MNPILTKIKGWWNAATPTQRLTTLGGGALTLVLVAAIASYAGKPKYIPLYRGLSPKDQAGVVTEAQALGIPIQFDTAGNVEVPEAQAATLNVRLATAGKLPDSGQSGVDAFKDFNIYTPPSVETEKLRAILEGKLASDIEAMPGVKSARVHIAVGDKTPFADQDRQATASITVTQGGTTLTSDQGQGIAMLVANAVHGLNVKDVVVLNEDAKTIFNGTDTVGSEHVATKKLDLEREVSKSEERKLQAALDTMFGAGSTLVSVDAEVDLDDEESTISSHKVKDATEVEVATEKAPMGADNQPQRAAGAAANGLAPRAPFSVSSSSGGGTYTNKVSRLEPGTVDTVTKRKKATGGLRRMLVNVAANSEMYKEEDRNAKLLQGVTAFVQNRFKNQTDTASFQAFVTPTPFNHTAEENAAKAAEEVSSSAKRQQIISLLPVGALLIVGFLVVRTLGKLGKPVVGSLAPALAGAAGALPGAMSAGLPGGPGYAMAGGSAAGLPGSSGSPLEAALSGHFNDGGLLGLPEGARRTEDGGIEFENDDERIRITKIKERTSIPLEQIRQMSVERPEAVAMLVKSWLMDEKR